MEAGADGLLEYYQRELTYLRRTGADFSQSYPKIARRLQLGPDDSADPSVERLIESFAFLTARIQKNLDAEFPRFTAALLELLYPQLAQAIPSLSIARFDVDPTGAKQTDGHVLPRHTALLAQTGYDARCRFLTTYPVTLWPVEVVEAVVESVDRFAAFDATEVAAVLRLRLRAPVVPFGQLAMRSLRFYLNTDGATASTLYELLFSNVRKIAFLSRQDHLSIHDASDALSAVGFGPGDALLPEGAGGQRAYGLLQEYFSFPEKFRFFDLVIPDLADADTVDVLFLLNERPKTRLSLGADTFALGCTPIVNLFPRHVEPLRLDRRRSEYRVVADARHEQTTEIHSILSVTGVVEGRELNVPYAPFFSYTHAEHEKQQSAYWHATRQTTGRRDLPGTDTLLSFVDLNFRPDIVDAPVVAIKALCTNRRLTEELSAGGKLQIEQAAPIARITLLVKPTPPRAPPLGGQTAWRLVSHLSVNHLSLSGGQEGLRAFTELLRLYAPGDPSAEQQIMGLRRLTTRPVVRRFGQDAWRGFCRGLEVALEIDPRRYVGSSAYLFGAVLNHFVALYAGINAFTQLTLCTSQDSGILQTWPPQVGTRKIL